MNIREKFILKLLCLLTLLGLSSAQAATPFDPDLVNATTFATQPVGYVGAPVASGYILTTSKSVFTIDYSSINWNGNLHSYAISSVGVISGTDSWVIPASGTVPAKYGAGPQIDTQNFSTGRYIVTMNGNTKTPFRWTSLSSTQQTNLGASTVLDYIRGDRSNETSNGGTYRTRTSAMGDVIHSTPQFWDDGTNQTVYVGANDGMLHAINATTGAERFAYIPSMLFPKLAALKASPYAHKYFVDGQLTAHKFGTQSILAGGLGGGGKGLFALDITSVPTSEADAATKILWEISNTTSGYANLGHTYGTPIMATLPDGTNALIVANGYNNTGNGHSSLFIINPVTGAKIAEIDAGTGTVAAPNGLSSPTLIDENLDGKMDTAYAGDIDGNLWRFDLTNYTATRLYTTNPVQSITMAPGYKSHPSGGYMVTFVTGKNFTSTDEQDTSTYYAYGIWDRTNASAYAANGVLLDQTLTERNYTVGTSTIRVRTATNNVPNWTAGAANNMGWKTPLPVGGERVVGDGAFVTGSTFLFLSSNPTINPNASPPAANWWMQLNALTGGDNGVVKFDLNADGRFTSADQVTVSSVAMSPVGRFMGGGVRSQLTAFTTSGYDIYFANYDKNGDPIIPVVTSNERGVAGGHFDQDIFYDFANSCPPIGGAPASNAVGYVTFDYAGTTTSKNVTALTIVANGETLYSGAPGLQSPKALDDLLDVISSTNYTITKNYGDNHTIAITAKNTGAAFNGTISVTMSFSSTGINSPGYTKGNLTGGADAIPSTGETTNCNTKKHVHEYDDLYDRTGVNMLDPSENQFDLSNAIPSTSTQFKVIASNQYLSPAVQIHLNGTYNSNGGYTQIKDFITSATLDLTNNTQVPTYTRATVNSLAINMPVDSFTQKNWWGGAQGLPADVRVGLHPIGDYQCAVNSDASTDGSMYKPINPPLTVTAGGNGTAGYNSSTTSLTATGVRHNGALVVQVIRADTPNTAIEMTIPSHPEYGWQVKAAYYTTYVLVEYVTFWHRKLDACFNSYGNYINGCGCYGESHWTKTPPQDLSGSDLSSTQLSNGLQTAALATDPKVGSFTGTGAVAGTTTTTVTNADGSTTTTVVVVTVSASGGTTTTTTVTNSNGGSTTTVLGDDIDVGGAVDSSGIIGGGLTTPLEALGRVNWRELFR
jgi:type IV pilus assembly protein PilY1